MACHRTGAGGVRRRIARGYACALRSFTAPLSAHPRAAASRRTPKLRGIVSARRERKQWSSHAQPWYVAEIMTTLRFVAIVLLGVLLASCGGDDTPARPTATAPPTSTHTPTALPTVTRTPSATATASPPRRSPEPNAGRLARPSRPSARSPAQPGRGSFRFGAATAATQIEDQNPLDRLVSLDRAAARRARRTARSSATPCSGYTHALDDVELLRALHLDSYRFSIEWARVEPQRDVINEAALAHYDAVIDALVAAGIRPNVTVHHFSSPVWVGRSAPSRLRRRTERHEPVRLGRSGRRGADHRRAGRARAPARAALRRSRRRLGTLNEPVNYLLSSYGIGDVPAGRQLLLTDFGKLITVGAQLSARPRRHLRRDQGGRQIDADGDGVAAQVGLTLNVVEWLPSHDNAAEHAAGRHRRGRSHPLRLPLPRSRLAAVRRLRRRPRRRRARRVTPTGRASSTGSASSTTAARASAPSRRSFRC